MFGVHYQEMLVVFLIVLLLFGGRKIPEIARGLGRGLREFKKARDEFDASLDAPDEPPAKKPSPKDDVGSGDEPESETADRADTTARRD